MFADKHYLTIDDIAEDLAMFYKPRYVKEVVVNRYDFPPPIKIGKRKVWTKEQYERWIESRKVA